MSVPFHLTETLGHRTLHTQTQLLYNKMNSDGILCSALLCTSRKGKKRRGEEWIGTEIKGKESKGKERN
jgi:hypothetical protein